MEFNNSIFGFNLFNTFELIWPPIVSVFVLSLNSDSHLGKRPPVIAEGLLTVVLVVVNKLFKILIRPS